MFALSAQIKGADTPATDHDVYHIAVIPRHSSSSVQKEITKTITLGRLETSEDFKIAEKDNPIKEQRIESLKITVRELSKEDVKTRSLPNQTTGLIITKIDNNSPLINSIETNSIILEAQKKKIRDSEDLNQAVQQVLKSNQKTILLVIYNSSNQRRYIGIKLD